MAAIDRDRGKETKHTFYCSKNLQLKHRTHTLNTSITSNQLQYCTKQFKRHITEKSIKAHTHAHIHISFHTLCHCVLGGEVGVRENGVKSSVDGCSNIQMEYGTIIVEATVDMYVVEAVLIVGA